MTQYGHAEVDMAALLKGLRVVRVAARLQCGTFRLPAAHCTPSLCLRYSSSSSHDKYHSKTSEQHLDSSGHEQEVTHSDSRTGGHAGEGDEEYETEEQLKRHVLTAALKFVPQCSWSEEAIAAGAQSLGLSSASAGLFAGGAADLVLHFVVQCNTQLAAMLRERQTQVQLGQAEPKEEADLLRDALETRLRMLIPYIDLWPQALSILLLPSNFPTSLKHLYTLVDDIWYYAGDRSTDMSWYSRRVALSGVYSTTELVMVQDSSPDFHNTWAFLDRRVQDMASISRMTKQVQSNGEAVVQGLMGTVITLKNLSGLNQRR